MPRNAFQSLFSHPKPVIGMVHLLPLPGSPRWDGSMDDVIQRALKDASALEGGGADGILIENFGDTPFLPSSVGPETVAAMTRVVTEIRKTIHLPAGVNVLRNDARAALAVATVTGCDFIRVNVHTGVVATDQGMIHGLAHEILRFRQTLGSRVLIFADVFVKHGVTLSHSDIGQAAQDAVHRGLADAVIVTGPATGDAVRLDDLESVRHAVGDFPVLAGSGVVPETVGEILRVADGVIAGTGVKADGVTDNPVDVEKVRELVRKRDGV